jgi:hypothetical protein
MRDLIETRATGQLCLPFWLCPARAHFPCYRLPGPPAFISRVKKTENEMPKYLQFQKIPRNSGKQNAFCLPLVHTRTTRSPISSKVKIFIV